MNKETGAKKQNVPAGAVATVREESGMPAPLPAPPSAILREHLVACWPFLAFAVLPVVLWGPGRRLWWYWPAQVTFLGAMQLGCWLQRRRRLAREALERRIAAWELEHYGRVFGDWHAR